MTQQFALPAAWIAEPYPTHVSFAYERPGRDDIDFRVEFTAGVPESEQLAVIALIENAPQLLTALSRLLDAIGVQRVQIHPGKMLDAIRDAVAVIAAVQGREVV